MPLLNSVITGRARTTLIDIGGTQTWPAAELTDYLYAFGAHACDVKPEAYPQFGPIALVAGPAQSVPVGATKVMTVQYNQASGKGILERSMDTLTHTIPGWAGAASAADVIGWFPDPRSPLNFWVYPPSPGGVNVMGIYGAVPPASAFAEASSFPLPDNYQHAAWAFVVAMALAKNTDKGDLRKFTQYMQYCDAVLVGNTQAQDKDAPTVEVVGSKN